MTTDAATGGQPNLRADARRNRERVLEVAKRHFDLHGVSASLEEIAREAGVGAGTLYRHFPSREALVAATLHDRQAELLGLSQQVRQMPDADAALSRWLEALQTYLRTFNGLPDPVLAALKKEASPLSLSCEMLAELTSVVLSRAQREGSARKTVSANDLFLGAIAIAWVLNRAEACGTSAEKLNAIFAHGYQETERS